MKVLFFVEVENRGGVPYDESRAAILQDGFEEGIRLVANRFGMSVQATVRLKFVDPDKQLSPAEDLMRCIGTMVDAEMKRRGL